MLYLNNALASSMLPDGNFSVETIQPEKVAEILSGEFTHCGNPGHWPTWQAVSKSIKMPVVNDPKGGRVALESGDQAVIVEVSGLPRETREFTKNEISTATFKFRLVTVS